MCFLFHFMMVYVINMRDSPDSGFLSCNIYFDVKKTNLFLFFSVKERKSSTLQVLLKVLCHFFLHPYHKKEDCLIDSTFR